MVVVSATTTAAGRAAEVAVERRHVLGIARIAFAEVAMGGVFVDTIKRVQDLMQARDMNLCVLAMKCGISYSTIQTTARRGGQLSVETIERICLGLGITLKDFFDSSYL